MAKQFAPRVYRDWLPLFATLTSEQAAEVLKGIAGYPDYEVKNVPMWDFFSSQLEKEYSAFCERTEKARGSAAARWSNAERCESKNADAPAQNEMRSDALQCDCIKDDANVCERIETHIEKCDRMPKDANAQNEMRTDTDECDCIKDDANVCERIETHIEKCDRMPKDANAQNEMRTDTDECENMQTHKTKCECMRSDANTFTKRKKEKIPPAPPEEEKNKNTYTPTNTSVCTPKAKNGVFVPPTVEEAQAYIAEQGYSVDAERFVDFYTAKGWFVGKNPMKDWKAAVRTWERDKQNAVRAGTVVSFGVKSGSYSGSTPL